VAFRNYVNTDWLKIFNDCSNNVESMWNKLKDMLLNGTTMFIPTVCKVDHIILIQQKTANSIK